SPLGKIYQASTYSGNPVSVKAGLTALKILAEGRETLYKRLEASGDTIRKGLRDIAEDAGLDAEVNGVASMFQIFFTDEPVVDYRTAKRSDTARFMRYQRGLTERGVFIPPSQFETCFISIAHTGDDLSRTLEAMEASIKAA
ncbi:MAG: aspartate aminotransferase family protein, partial [Candidatus Bathyarchaeia archaeon]